MIKTALVTGASSGLGLELCRQLINQNFKVFGVCRKPSAELKALDLQVIEGVDLTSEVHLNELASRFENDFLDLLFNNAGIFNDDEIEHLESKSLDLQWKVNAWAPLMFSSKMISKMRSPSKIAMMTSRMGSIEDNNSGGYYGYRMSKAALNAGSKSLAIDLKDRKIAVGIFHPGYVRTKMTSFQGDRTPEESIRGILKTLDRLDLKNSGTFWHSDGSILPW